MYWKCCVSIIMFPKLPLHPELTEIHADLKLGWLPSTCRVRVRVQTTPRRTSVAVRRVSEQSIHSKSCPLFPQMKASIRRFFSPYVHSTLSLSPQGRADFYIDGKLTFSRTFDSDVISSNKTPRRRLRHQQSRQQQKLYRKTTTEAEKEEKNAQLGANQGLREEKRHFFLPSFLPSFLHSFIHSFLPGSLLSVRAVPREGGYALRTRPDHEP